MTEIYIYTCIYIWEKKSWMHMLRWMQEICCYHVNKIIQTVTQVEPKTLIGVFTFHNFFACI